MRLWPPAGQPALLPEASLFNETLELWEKELFTDTCSEIGFYGRINVRYPPSKKLDTDLIDMNQVLPLIFGLIWLSTLVAVVWHLCSAC